MVEPSTIPGVGASGREPYGPPTRKAAKSDYIGRMNLSLTEAEETALRDLLRQTIRDYRYPLCPTLSPYRAIVAKLEPVEANQPLPGVAVAIQTRHRFALGSGDNEYR